LKKISDGLREPSKERERTSGRRCLDRIRWLSHVRLSRSGDALWQHLGIHIMLVFPHSFLKGHILKERVVVVRLTAK